MTTVRLANAPVFHCRTAPAGRKKASPPRSKIALVKFPWSSSLLLASLVCHVCRLLLLLFGLWRVCNSSGVGGLLPSPASEVCTNAALTLIWSMWSCDIDDRNAPARCTVELERNSSLLIHELCGTSALPWQSQQEACWSLWSGTL